eukprot:PhF_6_TR33492/c0_g1_i1/m.48832/K18416/THEX1, ERI1; 3'-5' exoribonuclease 1
MSARRKGPGNPNTTLPKARPTEVYLVIDFEATCDEGVGLDYPHEIIEFPCIALCPNTLDVVGEFHTYVRPILQPQLSPYCKKLTGIEQRNVMNAPDMQQAMILFDAWVQETPELRVTDPRNVTVVTDSPCDIGKFLHLHILRDQVKVPKYMRRWINLRNVFKKGMGRSPNGSLVDILREFGLEFEGTHHRGVDDARNVCRLMRCLKDAGCVLEVNECLP